MEKQTVQVATFQLEPSFFDGTGVSLNRGEVKC